LWSLADQALGKDRPSLTASITNADRKATTTPMEAAEVMNRFFVDKVDDLREKALRPRVSEDAPEVPEEVPDVPEEVPDVPEEVPEVTREVPYVPQGTGHVPQEVGNVPQEVNNVQKEPDEDVTFLNSSSSLQTLREFPRRLRA
jgi:hypothetical protein